MKNNNDYNYCARPLAAYASRPDQSRGRLIAVADSPIRTALQRDRDRIIHSSAYRRLKGKTQVFISHEGDLYRTRLTHTMEVAQIARTLARALFVNEDLAEAVALAHDLGHPPFAHMGEDQLKICMKPYGGFEHNDQSLRIVTALEERYPDHNGLNLTWESLEGIVKHNGPLHNGSLLPYNLNLVQKSWDLRLDTWPSIEAQVAGIADDVTYNSHDIEDGLNAGLFTLDDIAGDVPLVAKLYQKSLQNWPDLTDKRRMHDVVREVYGYLVTDVIESSRARIAEVAPQSPEDVRACGRCLVGFSDVMNADVQILRDFLMPRMYMHETVRAMRHKAERIVKDLFHAYLTTPQELPLDWQARDATNELTRTVSDYLAGMTDRLAMAEHARLFGQYDTLKHGT
jgi:dGTPase